MSAGHIIFGTGILIIFLLVISYFIPLSINTGTNFIVQDSILGIIIFHNPFILGLYILSSLALIIEGLKRIKK